MNSNLVVGVLVKIVTQDSPNYGKMGFITKVDTSRSNRHWYFIEATQCWYPDNELEVVGVSGNKSSPFGWNHGFPEVNDIVIVNNSESKHHNRTFMVVEVDRERQDKKPNHFYKLSNNCWYSLEELIPATGMTIKIGGRVVPLDNPVISDDDDVEDGDWEDEDNDSELEDCDPKDRIKNLLIVIIHEAHMLSKGVRDLDRKVNDEMILEIMSSKLTRIINSAEKAKENCCW